MGELKDVLARLRLEAARTLVGNMTPLIQIANGERPTGGPRQAINAPAKYAAADRIKQEMLAGYPGHNDLGDARRHAELSRRMAVEIGPVSSAVAGLTHEVDNSVHGQRWPERNMDLHNNAEGIRAAVEGRGVDPGKLQVRPAYLGPDLQPYGSKPPSDR